MGENLAICLSRKKELSLFALQANQFAIYLPKLDVLQMFTQHGTHILTYTPRVAIAEFFVNSISGTRHSARVFNFVSDNNGAAFSHFFVGLLFAKYSSGADLKAVVVPRSVLAQVVHFLPVFPCFAGVHPSLWFISRKDKRLDRLQEDTF